MLSGEGNADLGAILRGIRYRSQREIGHIRVNGLTDDSRAVVKGGVFIAVKGYSTDGQKFIGDAIKKGALAVISDRDFNAPGSALKIMVADARSSLPIIADNFYGHPSEKLQVIGVTGTNGKTTITYVMESIMKNSGIETGVLGTINYRMMGKVMPSGNTTPGPVKLLSMLSEMVKKGAGSVIMEVSSHSLDQHRVDGVSFDSAIFTNISSEHLDYHKTIDDYFKAKRLIFKRLKESGVAVINNDDKRVASLRRSIGKKVVTYGVRNKADITAKDIELSVHGSSFKVVTPETEFEAVTRLIGMHNISNILAGVAATSSIGLEPAYIKKGIESMVCVPGRLEPVGPGGRFRIFVDYAHTPDALFSVLRLLRDVATKDIITVFGCGGNRDRTKRPVMGRVACELSDRVIITSDNPRFEEPGDIIDEIEDGIRDTFSNYEIITDRRDAIAKALKMARKDSVVIIAGKGHENYQIIKDRTMPFDDRLVVRDMLKNKP